MKASSQPRYVRPLASEPSDHALQSPYLNAHEAAQYLKFKNAAALYKAVAHGLTNALDERIPVLRRGRTLLFHRDEIDRWLHADTVGRSLTRVSPLSGVRANHTRSR